MMSRFRIHKNYPRDKNLIESQTFLTYHLDKMKLMIFVSLSLKLQFYVGIV